MTPPHVCTDGANNAGKPLPCGPAEDVEAAIEVDDGRGPDRAALLTGQSGLGKDFLGILIWLKTSEKYSVL